MASDEPKTSFFDITPSEAIFKNLKDKVILITGCSSGIGLATSKLMLSLGAKVAGGDINPAPITEGSFVFVKTDVTSWDSQLQLFEKTVEKFGRVDHVFANAGE
jgi:NAD(P)-dependent dehydrogenase (short-subunit alcohol dehydrogenase family)